MKFVKSNALKPRFNKIIPGGSHTYAKGDDQFPEFAAPYLVKGKGCKVWDVDGNEYIEYGMGLRAVTLGHAYPPIVKAAQNQMEKGCNFGRPNPIELECAEQLLGLIEKAEMVKFAKNGSDVTSAALKLARAYTGKNMVAICADHPFFSVDDWFIGSTAINAGIPSVISDMTVKFHYNDLDSLENLFQQYPNQIACVFLEAEKQEPPKEGFFDGLQSICKKYGALLILDEIITGFRWHLNGAQKMYNINPDLSTFGKALANGYSLAALAGKKEIMQLGGLNHDVERVFLLSTTNGAEYHSLAAAIATMKIYKQEQVIEFLDAQGKKLKDGITRSISELNLTEYFEVLGKPCALVFATKDQNKHHSQAFRTLFLQETINRGLIMPSLVVSYSHSDQFIYHTIEKIHEALIVYKKALNEGIEKYLIGKPVKPVYRKHN